MKKIILMFILLSVVTAQEKYLIYFSDKGISEEQFESQKSTLLKSGKINLTEKAIERRKKVLGEDYFTYKDLPVNQEYLSELNSHAIKIDKKLKWFNAVSAYLSDTQIEELSSLAFVKKIEKVRTINFKRDLQKVSTQKSKIISSSYLYDYGASLPQDEFHDIPVVHNAGYTGEGIIIGFLDSGFRWKDHPALKKLDVLYEYDYVQNDSVTANQNGDHNAQDYHGTAVFSIGAGFAEGNLIGPAFGASFFLAKTEDITSETRVEEDNFAAAVEDFEAMGADIITASLSYSTFDSAEESYSYEDMNGETTIVAKAYNQAYDLGVVTVNAAGNEGSSSWHYITSPADAFGVISVGNVKLSGELNPTSSRGPTADGRIKPEVTAMGTYNYHAVPGGSYSDFEFGTSFSAPMVAGMIGQLLSAYPYLTNLQVRNLVLQSGNNFENPNDSVGYGAMSILRALNYPNLREFESGELQINKMFLGEGVSSNEDFAVHFKINNGSWQEQSFTLHEDNIYSFTLPQSYKVGKDIVYFYYTYRDSLNILVSEPTGNETFVLFSNENVFTGEKPGGIAPDYILERNYPNPFNQTTTIRLYSLKNATARVEIINILGQVIKELLNDKIVRGITTFRWNGTNQMGEKVSSGVYLFNVRIENSNYTQKMILLR